MEDGVKLEVGAGVKEWVVFGVGDGTGFRAGLGHENRVWFRNQDGVECVGRAGVWRGLGWVGLDWVGLGWVGEEVMDEHGVGLETRAGVKVGVEIADGLCALTLPSPHTHGQPPEACLLLFTRVLAPPYLCRCPCCL